MLAYCATAPNPPQECIDSCFTDDSCFQSCTRTSDCPRWAEAAFDYCVAVNG